MLPLRATAPCRWLATPAGGQGVGRGQPLPCRGPWLQPAAPAGWSRLAAPLQGALPAAGCLLSQPRPTPPPRGSCCEHVERFYIIQSHHTQFKTNLLHENLALIPLLGNLSREIVYPCIPNPNGEDEGGQASSSLAVSTRWIFAAKLLQYGLATLAQREGGE
ncbi:hypothetical protein GW17_00045997 [Ensete ventricosum]|nr:hypothetical protein GW17_00045997 [Ensete ventricosum]RZS17928.1 hypothetical protein BHM03_00050146 [Ensete ventricosum]